MHILLLPSWYSTEDKPWRGTFVDDQARALARQGAEVGLAFVERRSLSNLTPRTFAGSHFQVVCEEDEFRTVRMKGWSTWAQTVPGSIFWAHLTRLLVRRYVDMYGVPDVVHGHAALWGGHAAMLVARDLGCPYMITEHSSTILTNRLNPAERAAAARAYNGAAAVIAVSHHLADCVDRVAGRSVSTVLANTIDTDYFHPPAVRRDSRDRFTFLAVCDLVDYKRVDQLISAFARVHIRRPRTRLVVVGAGKDARQLRALAEILGVEDHVHFAGALPRSGVRNWLWEADAFVLPSAFETFGVVLLEALSTGLPVIATRSGGPQEIVSREDGILIPCGDEGALLDAMVQMTHRRMDVAARHDMIRRHFGYETIAHRLNEIYAAVVSARTNVVPIKPIVDETKRARSFAEEAIASARRSI